MLAVVFVFSLPDERCGLALLKTGVLFGASAAIEHFEHGIQRSLHANILCGRKPQIQYDTIHVL